MTHPANCHLTLASPSRSLDRHWGWSRQGRPARGINKGLEKYKLRAIVCVCVRACHTLTHMLIKERGWKRKTFPPKKKITQSVLSLDWKVSNFLCTHHAFKFGNNFSLCDFSCFATNIANSQKTDRKGNGNRNSEFKSWFFPWLAVWPCVYSRP